MRRLARAQVVLSSAAMYLVGDIGGTNTRLALMNSQRRVVRQETFASRKFASLYDAARLFGLPAKLDGVCLGVAGPVIAGKCVVTNLPWRLDETELKKKLNAKRARLVNDLVVVGWGAANAPRAKLLPLSGKVLPQRDGRNLAIIAPGTGLGEAALVAHGDDYVLLGTEGSHSDFAPRDELEAKLLQYLQKHFGRVSTERALCGPALPLLYGFFEDVPESEANVRLLANATDFNVTMVKLGLAKKSARARATLELFASLLGAEAGNMVLRYLAVGGVYVAGSLAAAVLPQLKGHFMRSFVAKGRYKSMLEQVPVAVVNDSQIGILGAALLARE